VLLSYTRAQILPGDAVTGQRSSLTRCNLPRSPIEMGHDRVGRGGGLVRDQDTFLQKATAEILIGRLRPVPWRSPRPVYDLHLPASSVQASHQIESFREP
jgi:hypothetical protein